MTSIEDRPERDAQATAGSSGVDPAPIGGFAKRKNRGNLRKRPAEDSEDAGGTNAINLLLNDGFPANDKPLFFPVSDLLLDFDLYHRW